MLFWLREPDGIAEFDNATLQYAEHYSKISAIVLFDGVEYFAVLQYLSTLIEGRHGAALIFLLDF